MGDTDATRNTPTCTLITWVATSVDDVWVGICVDEASAWRQAGVDGAVAECTQVFCVGDRVLVGKSLSLGVVVGVNRRRVVVRYERSRDGGWVRCAFGAGQVQHASPGVIEAGGPPRPGVRVSYRSIRDSVAR